MGSGSVKRKPPVTITRRSDAEHLEEAFRESEERYRTLFDSIDEGFCIVEVIFDANDKPLDYRFLHVNRAFEGATGLKDAEGKRMLELEPKHEEHWFRIYGEIALTGIPQRFENRAEHLHRYYDVYAFRFGQAEDRQVAILFKDISKRKLAEEALRDAKARMEMTLAANEVGTWTWDPQQDRVLADQNLAHMFSVSPEDAERGAPIAKFLSAVHPEDRARIHRIITGALRSKTGQYEAEYRLVSDDSIRWVMARGAAQFDSEGKVSQFPGVVIDITERRRAEEALRESEEKFRDLADNISQFAWMTDAQGWIFWYNRRWFEYTGTTLEEMQGWGWKKVHHPEHLDRVVEKFRRALASGEPWEDTFPLRGKGGIYRWFLSRAIPIRDEKGNLVRWFGTNTDITELRAAQIALREAEKIAATGQLASSIAHEINNPMQALTNLLVLASYKAADDGARGLLEMAQQELQRMSRITKQMLSFQNDPSASVPVKISEVLEDAVEFWADRLRTRRISVIRKYESSQDIPAFPGEMRQLFANILGNASEASPDGASVQIHFYDSVDWKNSARRGVRVTITDRGKGIPKDEENRMFEPFFSTKGEKGRGLGLWVARGIAARHQGSIHFRSSNVPGREGTCFSIFLPQISPIAVLAEVH